MNKIKDSWSAIKISTELKRELKKYLGQDFSKVVTDSIRREIKKKKDYADKFLHCFICDEQENEPEEMIYCPYPCDGEEDPLRVLVFVCSECVERLAIRSLDDYKKLLKNLDEKSPEAFRLYKESMVAVMMGLGEKHEYSEKNKMDYVANFRLEPDSFWLTIFYKLAKAFPKKYSVGLGKFIIKTNFLEDFEKDFMIAAKIVLEGDSND